jgi:hypothetical protein
MATHNTSQSDRAESEHHPEEGIHDRSREHHALARAHDLVGDITPERATDDEPDGPEGQRVGGLPLRLPIGIHEIGHGPQPLHHRHREQHLSNPGDGQEGGDRST